MKKITILTLFSAFLFAGISANAQEQGDIRVGAGLAIGTKASVDEDTGDSKLGMGINLGAEYLITDAISIAPSYTFFFPKEVGGADFSTNALNIDARYYFTDSGLYGLLGFTSVTGKVEGGGLSISDSESGLNLGAGIMIPINESLFFNGQAKYQTAGDAGDGQIVLNLGVAFGL